VIATWVGFARAGQTAGPLLAGVGLDAYGARPVFAAGAVLAGILLVVQRPLLASASQARAQGKLAGAPNL